MREILFRGKVINNKVREGQFVYGSYTEWGNIQSVITEKGGYFENHAHEVDPLTVGQYADKNDIHENKIFEGDIIQTTWEIKKTGSVMKGIVEFNNSAFSILWNDADYGRISLWRVDDIEVIGNIYDNPELLENLG